MVKINRVAKVVKGGRRFSFTALVVVGDEIDHVGVGYGKANEVPSAIAKAVEDAKKNLFQIPKYKNTVTHQVLGRYGAGRVLLKPASEGTGVIAGAGVRAVLELGGVRDILAKSLGTANPINLLMATVDGLKALKRPEDVARLRGKQIARRDQAARRGRGRGRRQGCRGARSRTARRVAPAPPAEVPEPVSRPSPRPPAAEVEAARGRGARRRGARGRGRRRGRARGRAAEKPKRAPRKRVAKPKADAEPAPEPKAGEES